VNETDDEGTTTDDEGTTTTTDDEGTTTTKTDDDGRTTTADDEGTTTTEDGRRTTTTTTDDEGTTTTRGRRGDDDGDDVFVGGGGVGSKQIEMSRITKNENGPLTIASPGLSAIHTTRFYFGNFNLFRIFIAGRRVGTCLDPPRHQYGWE
jgi:hypothetical protein